MKQLFFQVLPLRSVSFGTTVVALISDNQTGKLTVQSHRTTVKLFGRELDCVVAWCRRGQPANCERKQSDRQSSALQDSTCCDQFELQTMICAFLLFIIKMQGGDIYLP